VIHLFTEVRRVIEDLGAAKQHLNDDLNVIETVDSLLLSAAQTVEDSSQ
jgi:hypothetical protein